MSTPSRQKPPKATVTDKDDCYSCLRHGYLTSWVKAAASIGFAIAAIITACQTSNVVTRITSLESKVEQLDAKTRAFVYSSEGFLANSFVENLPEGGSITYSEFVPFVNQAMGNGASSAEISKLLPKDQLQTVLEKINKVPSKEQKAQVLKETLDTVRKPPSLWNQRQLQEYLDTGRYPNDVLLKKK